MSTAYLMGSRRRPVRVKSELEDLRRELHAQGIETVLGFEEELFDLSNLPSADVYLVLSRAPFWLSMAEILESQGKLVVNSAAACRRTVDKLVTNALLSAADVPVPESFYTLGLNAIGELLKDGPLLFKPRFGERSEGLKVLRRVEELDNFIPGPPLYLIQRLLEVDGPDLKVYVIGESIFGFQKRAEGPSFNRDRFPIELDEEVKAITRNCAKALDLELFGLDIIRSEGQYFVVDVNLFPGFRRIPEAAKLVARHIATRVL